MCEAHFTYCNLALRTFTENLFDYAERVLKTAAHIVSAARGRQRWHGALAQYMDYEMTLNLLYGMAALSVALDDFVILRVRNSSLR